MVPPLLYVFKSRRREVFELNASQLTLYSQRLKGILLKGGRESTRRVDGCDIE